MVLGLQVTLMKYMMAKKDKTLILITMELRLMEVENLLAPQKMWIIAQDERTCDICSELDGEIVPWDGTFSSGDETPGRVHPNCRCTMVIIPPERRS